MWPSFYEQEDAVEKTLERLDTDYMEQIQEILNICEVKPAVLQTEVHPYFQEKERKEFLAKKDIAIQAWYLL